MPKIRMAIEDISEEQAEHIREQLSHLAGCTVTIGEVPLAAELTPGQKKAFEEEWSKPHYGHITWEPSSPGHVKVRQLGAGIREHDILGSWATGEIIDGDTVDPGPALGEHLTDIDADESCSDIRERIREDVARLCGMITHLEMRLAAEGEHTEAANAEIDRLKTELAVWKV